MEMKHKHYMISSYPSIPRRYMSTVIDGMITLMMFIAISYLFQGDDLMTFRARLCSIFIFIIFYEPLCTSKFCTIGQWIMRIRVKDYKTGKNISLFAAYPRLIIKYFLGIISFLTIPVDSARRGIHDIAVGSVVVVAR